MKVVRLSPHRIFLSSTAEDLQEERNAVRKTMARLGHWCVAMEDFGSYSELPFDTCKAEIKKSDVMVLVVGNRYGTMVPSEQFSFTEGEYRHAIQMKVRVFVYIRRELGEKSLQEEEKRFIEFVDQLRKNHGVSYFTSPEHLVSEVTTALAKRLPPASKALDWRVFVLGVLAAAVVTTLGLSMIWPPPQKPFLDSELPVEVEITDEQGGTLDWDRDVLVNDCDNKSLEIARKDGPGRPEVVLNRTCLVNPTARPTLTIGNRKFSFPILDNQCFAKVECSIDLRNQEGIACALK